MKIGIDYSSVSQQKTGIGVFAESLVEELQKRADRDCQFYLYRPGASAKLNTPARMWWESVLLPSRARRDKTDLLYSPGFACPRYAHCARVVTVHDLIGLVYPGNVRAWSRLYWSRWLPANLKKAQVLVASSERTRQDIVRFLKVDSSKIKIVPLAAKPHYGRVDDRAEIEATLKKYGLGERFLISVSTLEPRKNFLRLLKAYQLLTEKGRADFEIVIVGKPGGAESELHHFIAEKNLSDRVRILGYVPDADLTNLYNGALGYVMISLYEGFGLPVLEAMRCGLTGIVSDNSSIPEITADTAIKINPLNEAEIAEALLSLVSDSSLRVRMSGEAYERSRMFSVERMASQMMTIFNDTIK